MMFDSLQSYYVVLGWKMQRIYSNYIQLWLNNNVARFLCAYFLGGGGARLCGHIFGPWCSALSCCWGRGMKYSEGAVSAQCASISRMCCRTTSLHRRSKPHRSQSWDGQHVEHCCRSPDSRFDSSPLMVTKAWSPHFCIYSRKGAQ